MRRKTRPRRGHDEAEPLDWVDDVVNLSGGSGARLLLDAESCERRPELEGSSDAYRRSGMDGSMAEAARSGDAVAAPWA